MSLRKERKIIAHNHLVQGLIVSVVIFIIAFFMIDLDQYLTLQVLGLEDFSAFDDAFVRFGSVLVFFYEFLPQSLMLLGITGIVVRLLDSGVSPIALIFILVIGKLIGQYILYSIGRFSGTRVLKNKNSVRNADHLMHKYRTVIFILPIFLGFVGDAILFIAGHQRIGFIKIIPLLILGNTLRIGIWIANVTAQSNLPGFF